MKRSDLAALLGISRGMLSRLESRGMPVHSLQAAAAWRQANLHPGRRKALPGASGQRITTDDALALALARVEAADMRLRDVLAQPGTDRAALQAELRAAMRAVPGRARADVELWLCCWIDLLGFEPLIADPDVPEVLDDSRPWYAIACGEVPA